MEICWDNLEKLRYNPKTGKWIKGSNAYIYMDSCEECGEPYITMIYKISFFCSISCSKIGKKRSEETKKKISNAVKGKNNPMYGTINKNV